MANPISTTGTTNEPVSTPHQTGWSTRDWAQRHGQNLDGETPTGDLLSTEWVSASGPQSVDTVRDPGESDGDFKDRHKAEYQNAMATEPPIP